MKQPAIIISEPVSKIGFGLGTLVLKENGHVSKQDPDRLYYT